MNRRSFFAVIPALGSASKGPAPVPESALRIATPHCPRCGFQVQIVRMVTGPGGPWPVECPYCDWTGIHRAD